ncbi:MAG: hypothetical protein WD709_03150 [Gammaproteobacteria bacterium]
MPRILIILFRTFFDICLFRKGPQDLPAARELFWLVMLCYGAISVALSFPYQTFYIAVITGVTEALMLLLITYTFVYLRSVTGRWRQTSTALAGTGVIFSLMAFPLFYLRVYLQSGPALQAFIGMVIICLILWNIAVMTHILKNALSSSYFLGVLASLAYIALISFTLQVVLPVEAGT